MAIGGIIGKVKFRGSDTIEWAYDRVFKKQTGIKEDNVALLKKDEPGFIHKLTGRVWLTSDEGSTSLFKSTFSTDSGVVETFSSNGDLITLDSWGVSSGVLKIGYSLIIEARVSDSYMIGLDDRDQFVVFQAMAPATLPDRSDLVEQRSEFLTVLTTSTWRKEDYGSYYDYKFRPIEGPLQGREAQFKNDNLQEATKWEYSPATGALRIGHTEYVGGLLIGDTLALLDKQGKQTFYNRSNSELGNTSTVSDVDTHRINEMRGFELANVLSGQFQKGPYLYAFEFEDGHRTGFVHEWRSIPFTITAHELTTELFEQVEAVFEVEGLLFFDDHFALKRDATASRLRPKARKEVQEDKEIMEKRLRESGEDRLVLRIRDKSGNIHEMPLPITSMEEVSEIQISSQ